MKRLFLKIKNVRKLKRGFILPFAILIATLILSVSLGVSSILVKEIFFSNLNRESSISYYAADTAMECAVAIENINQAGGGIFPNGELGNEATSTFININTDRHTNFSSTTIFCATVPIFDSSISSFKVEDCTEIFCANGMDFQGKTSTFNMRMDLGDGEFRCANVSVTKTPTKRRIISRGYNTCNLSGNNVIERAIIDTTD